MSPPLNLPSITYGPFADVRRRMSGAIRRFAAGVPWHQALAAGDMVSTDTTTGLIVLNGPAPLLAREPHFHAFLPLSLVLEGVSKGEIDDSRKQQAVHESLSAPWGLLGILAPVNQMLVYPPAQHRPILQAATRWWDTLDSVGPRYTAGLREGARLWDVPNNLHYVLGQMGLSNEQLRALLPADGLRAIVPPDMLE